jgi:hypothetical protein
MPKNEPDHSDPLELTGVAFDDPTGESVRIMAECFADEFLNLGHPPAEVMAIFRSPEHRLAHHAWQTLGEVNVFTMVQTIARRHEEIRERVRRSRAARGV